MKVRFAVSPGPGALDGDGLIAFADALEASGFDGAWLSDLPLGPAVDPLLGLALIAGRTSRLKLGANVVPLGRNPYLLAKELAQLDRLSHGRLLLSFVPGLGQPGEREALGVGGANRGALLEESLGLLRRWWDGETIDYAGAALAPPARPLQDPLEVWLGGRAPAALERAGRIADGWLGASVTPGEAGAARRTIMRAAVAAGREIDPEHYGLSIPYARAELAPPALEALRRGRRDIDPRALVPASQDALRELILRHLDAGLSKFVVRPVAPVASWPGELEWLGGAILELQSP